MWSQSLAAGAVDCCFASDVPRILQAPERYVAFKEAQAALGRLMPPAAGAACGARLTLSFSAV